MDRSLLFLLIVALVNVVVVGRSALARTEKLGLVLFQMVIGCVSTGAALAATIGVVGAGRCLLACAAGPLTVLLVRVPTDLPSRLATGGGWASAALLGLGLIGESLLLMGVVGPAVALVPALAVVGVAVVLALSAWRRRQAAHSRLARAKAGADCVAALCLATAGFSAGVSTDGNLWAPLLAVAASLATSARVVAAPPDQRDLVVVVLGVLLSAVVVEPAALPLLAAAFAVAVLSRSALYATTRSRSSNPEPLPNLALPAGLGGFPPLLDDALLRRPGRPRVMARTPARRLLDAALDRAQRAQPQHRGRPPVEVSSAEGDADVDGDPSELAEALCVVLDNALRQQARHPWARISIIVRAASQTVSFEVNDTAPGIPDSETPFAAHRTGDLDGPFQGVGLARARLLVERHGGQLHARQGPEGSAVQLTLPRRLPRSATASA